MHATRALTLICILITLVPCQGADADLLRLRKSYQEARERALAPLNATYEKELSKLLERQMKAGNLAAAVETQKELDSLKALTPVSLTVQPKDDPPGVERLFVGKNWESPLGTVFQLKRNGSGVKILGSSTAQVTWEKVGSDVIKVSGQKDTTGRIPTWHLKFVSEEEAYIGNSPTNTNEKLTLK